MAILRVLIMFDVDCGAGPGYSTAPVMDGYGMSMGRGPPVKNAFRCGQLSSCFAVPC